MSIVVIMGKWSDDIYNIIIYLVIMFDVVWCLALWLVCLVLCGHQCTSAREWSVRSHLR